MTLESYRHLWGVDEPLPAVFPKIKALGYTGIETGLGGISDKVQFRELFTQHGFKMIAMIFTSGMTVREHLDSFQTQVEEARDFKATFINSHSGADAFSREDSLEFFRGAIEIEKASGLQVVHETHRGRILYNPWITQFVLNELPAVKLCADFSHWVCVCERLLNSELDIIQQAADHTFHLHARVGFEQGPQVSDPRAPEYQTHVKAHESWWDLVWASQRRRGFMASSITPEFGPPPYLPMLPYKLSPVANLWDICEWQNQRQRQRFAA